MKKFLPYLVYLDLAILIGLLCTYPVCGVIASLIYGIAYIFVPKVFK